MVPDVFDLVAAYVRDACGDDPLCVHVDDVAGCQIERHPKYEKFRSQAVTARMARKGVRLWESMVSMGRMSDLRGESKWRMIVVDCLTPFLRAHSRLISREFYRDPEDVRSDMLEAALTTWKETAKGVPPRDVPELMVKSAIRVAYQRAGGRSAERLTSDVEELLALEESFLDSSIAASSIICDANPRDPAVAEQIRGERTGALWQRYGLSDRFNHHHKDLREGRRVGVRSALASETMLARTFVTGCNSYYYTSDIYPKFVDLPAAAEAMGIAKTTAYTMVRAGSFPCPPIRMAGRYQVITQALMQSLRVPDVIVHADDVENGADHASRGHLIA
ncbi:helix-turn-helix transcriptional regulator [Streptomyces sp. NPDC059897]|uniref:helix-turn-helix transcriptional regulator n=1 Tax=Streptomyces sp. NPDC059897 TaxID=3346994 RepID=UPI0036476931